MKNIKKPKVLILDCKTWRCGGDEHLEKTPLENCLGKGETVLLNKEGYMCCLGQFSLQVNPELKSKDILFKGAPDVVECDLGFLQGNHCNNSDFSNIAVEINDDDTTTLQQKLLGLAMLCAAEDIELQVKNEHLIYKSK